VFTRAATGLMTLMTTFPSGFFTKRLYAFLIAHIGYVVYDMSICLEISLYLSSPKYTLTTGCEESTRHTENDGTDKQRNTITGSKQVLYIFF
jgi:hypothetical protein